MELFGLKWSDMDWENSQVHVQRTLNNEDASLLIEQGENIKYIRIHFGHSSPTVTWNIYAHLMKKVNQEVVSRLENIVFNPSGPKMVTTE